jgi:hypothetical protein
LDFTSKRVKNVQIQSKTFFRKNVRAEHITIKGRLFFAPPYPI